MSGAIGTSAATETAQESRVASGATATQIVVCLGPWYENATAEQLHPLLVVLREALGELAPEALVAYPVSDPHATSWEHERMLLQPYLPTARLKTWFVPTATSYLSMYEIMRAHNSACGLLLGADAHTLQPAAMRALVDAVLVHEADLAITRYAIGANQGLINTAVLHPLSRALFGMRAAFPLSLDVALSNRMAERMAAAAQRMTTASQPESIVWAVSEAAVAGFNVAEIDAGIRDLPHPAGSDLSTILNTTAASMFSDIEAKAAFWQRVRPVAQMLTLQAAPMPVAAMEAVPTDEIAELIGSFRIGYGNLHEIWSLVLPPQTLLGLKRLSTTADADFTMPDALWVRIVYDFVLAHRLRTINRSHLLGSFTPLYLAWVASHILNAQPSATENLARAFVADKPYLVSRWRWPDRFNP